MFKEAYTAGEAYELDSKIDDGMPLSGAVFAEASANHIANSPPAPSWRWTGTVCVADSTTNEYAPPDVGYLPACSLSLKLNF